MFWWSQDISYDPPERRAGISQQPSRDSATGKPSGPQSPGLPRGLSSKEAACLHRRCGFGPWVGKIPLWRKWQPTPVPLPGKSHGRRSLADSGPGVTRSQAWLSKCACTHSSSPALSPPDTASHSHVLEGIRRQRRSLMLIHASLPDTERNAGRKRMGGGYKGKMEGI